MDNIYVLQPLFGNSQYYEEYIANAVIAYSNKTNNINPVILVDSNSLDYYHGILNLLHTKPLTVNINSIKNIPIKGTKVSFMFSTNMAIKNILTGLNSTVYDIPAYKEYKTSTTSVYGDFYRYPDFSYIATVLRQLSIKT